MTYTPAQLAASKAVQQAAAHDLKPQLRLLAGPGTGKSYSIGERVAWLIGGGAAPPSIWAISFTNAATNDLREGILKYCSAVTGADQIRVATLHSLALTLLAKGGKLNYYPVRPRVLDEWEQRYVFDEELALAIGTGISRCGELRAFFESRWSTGAPPPPFISAPTTPIAAGEVVAFQAFYNRVTQTYSCLLPGEAVRKCIDEIKTGTLDPIALTGMAHIIVDEYQDLNPADVEFVDLLIGSGIVTFACGDDDQSIYAFRYAYPAGIQSFVTRHTAAGSHTLPVCFRCASVVLAVANRLITAFPPSARLPKNLTSAYDKSAPPVAGQVAAWQFSSAPEEAKAVADSIAGLISAGVPPEEVLVLIGSRGAQLKPILSALSAANVPADVQRDVELSKSDGVRFVYAILRQLRNDEDFLALRTLLGLQKGVGVGRCDAIARVCAANGLSFRDQFTTSRSTAFFDKAQLRALDGVKGVLAATQGWSGNDDLASRRPELEVLTDLRLAPKAQKEWKEFADLLPAGITLAELTDVLAVRTQRDTRELMKVVYARLNVQLPAGLDPSGRIRVMTLHSCKGLSAQAVFIPGLEEEIIPGPYRAQFPAQVEEAARLLYVGITRARALCVLSFARSRVVNGKIQTHGASRFLPSLGLTFQSRPGLTTTEIGRAIIDISNL